MTNLILSAILLTTGLVSQNAAAATKDKCTTEPKEKWQDQKAFQEKLKTDGYKIKVFKVTKGDCYEIYGWNKEGKKVEIYFNPVDGSVVKENLEK